MKTLKVRSNFVLEIKVPDNFNAGDEDVFGDEFFKIVEETLHSNNECVSNRFWEDLYLACIDCGVTLNLPEECEDGRCLQCEAVKNK